MHFYCTKKLLLSPPKVAGRGSVWYTNAMKWETQVHNEEMTRQLADQIARQLAAPLVIELVGDVGAGKTTFTRHLARALGVTEPVQSPTFTLSRVYGVADGRRLVHYDFYRLGEAGIIADELAETSADNTTITVVEWASSIDAALPKDRLVVHIVPRDEQVRDISLHSSGPQSDRVIHGLSDAPKHYVLAKMSDAWAELAIVDARGKEIAMRHWEAGRSLARDLHQELEQLAMFDENHSWQDIAGIGVYAGPGSFTSLRIGLTVLNTYAHELRLPIAGVQGDTDTWKQRALQRLVTGEHDEIVMPQYGAPAHITAPRK